MPDSTPSIHLGEIIEKILKDKHISHAHLARELDMSPQNIRKNILEKEFLSTDKIQRINAILDCNLFDYFTTPSDRSTTTKDCDSSQVTGDKLMDEIAAQRRLTEAAQDLASKAQQQIDELIQLNREQFNKFMSMLPGSSQPQ